MATEIMDASKRAGAIKRLAAKLETENPWYPEYEADSQMLRTLRKEEADYQNKIADQ